MSKNNSVILTFDLEFWYNSEFLNEYLPENKSVLKKNIQEEIDSLLPLLKKHKAKATFFVLSEIVNKYPDLINRIYMDGHEIASHGSSHKILTSLSESGFEKELVESINEIKEKTGERPIGFRAPTFSLNNQSKWLIKILKKYKFKYDSSIFPFFNHLYGNPNGRNDLYKISQDNVFSEDRESSIMEMPVCVIGKSIFRIPIPGGFYFRVMPLYLFKLLLDRYTRKFPAVLYFHPHELYNFVPNIKIPFLKKKLKFWGVKKALNKFSKLLESSHLDFISAKDYLNKYHDKN